MPTVTIEEGQANLASLIAHLQPGEPLVITQDTRPVARLMAEEKPESKPRKAGNCIGMIKIISEDEEHLKDFEEYR